MNPIQEKFQIETNPVALPEALVQVEQARFTILTPRLIRMEYSPDNIFEDRASQAFWHRRQPVPQFQVRRPDQTGETRALEIETPYLHLLYQPGQHFHRDSLSVRVKETGKIWRPGDPNPGNLGGPVRTLDREGGAVPLGPGLVSRLGWVLVDDSRSLVFNDQSWLEPRQAGGSPGDRLDWYFFGYGRDYPAALNDYAKISGPVPLIPRWALGNWWSRYWEYTQEELSELMLDFKSRRVPLSICIIDMDWHITETGNRCSGWTGYTWNRKLFPEPAQFLNFLHEQGLKTALNLHPAEGIHPHEEMYQEIARHMGMDPEQGEPVQFDLADPVFAAAYFELLHHPHEDMGVDFWWIDWQQGELTRMPGLDPLWWLNHLHALDLARSGSHRPFLFSRWGGLGNHRYPIGFSGDTQVTWEALAFQPYFTSASANVFYNWWSHDIGGHMFGMEEAELYARWVQYGVFSPILRLHSTKIRYHQRLPWGYDAETFENTRAAMTLRHALIPYIYTQAWREHSQNQAPIRPMYHAYPEREEAYACPNQYFFGSELLAAPFTSRVDPDTQLARQVIWLPEGEWFHFERGERFSGEQWLAYYGSLRDIPVFARAGAIIPMERTPQFGKTANPVDMRVRVYPGADNRFDLYEDDGETLRHVQGAYALTPLAQTWHAGQMVFEIGPVQGDREVVPPAREWEITFYALQAPEKVDIRVNGSPIDVQLQYAPENHSLVLSGIRLAPDDHLVVKLQGEALMASETPLPERLNRLLNMFRMDTMTKFALASQLEDIAEEPGSLGNFRVGMKPAHLRLLLETITEAGFEWQRSTGEEKLLLWNNGRNERVQFQLSIERPLEWDLRQRFEHQSGSLPHFQIIPIEKRLGEGSWTMKIDYLHVLTLEQGRSPGIKP
jgi:hypothetical protein